MKLQQQIRWCCVGMMKNSVWNSTPKGNWSAGRCIFMFTTQPLLKLHIGQISFTENSNWFYWMVKLVPLEGHTGIITRSNWWCIFLNVLITDQIICVICVTPLRIEQKTLITDMEITQHWPSHPRYGVTAAVHNTLNTIVAFGSNWELSLGKFSH